MQFLCEPLSLLSHSSRDWHSLGIFQQKVKFGVFTAGLLRDSRTRAEFLLPSNIQQLPWHGLWLQTSSVTKRSKFKQHRVLLHNCWNNTVYYNHYISPAHNFSEKLLLKQIDLKFIVFSAAPTHQETQTRNNSSFYCVRDSLQSYLWDNHYAWSIEKHMDKWNNW